jgi:hypothetical protein
MLQLSGLGQKIRRAFTWNESSFPFLSGDTFRLSCQFAFASVSDFRADTIWSEIDIVFCKSEQFEVFKSEKPAALNPKILICGNSDYEFHSFDVGGLKNLRAAFLQNSFISDGRRIFTLPIGLENLKYANNGRTIFYKKSPSHEKLNKVLVGPFGNTHDERVQLKLLPESESLIILRDRINTRAHIENLTRFKFVACPRGNGVDTHRTWETMYQGSVPILLRNSWSESLQEFGFKALLLDSWEEISAVTASDFDTDLYQIRNFPYMWMPQWIKLIDSLLP